MAQGKYATLLPRAPNGLWLVVLGVLAGLGFIVAGLLIQDWNCGKDNSCGPTTGGRGDKTLFTWVTDFTLGVLCLLMALLAPTTGEQRMLFAFGFGLQAVAWIADGIPPFLTLVDVTQADPADRYLSPLSLVTFGCAHVIVLGAFLLSMRRFSCCFAGIVILVLGGAYCAVYYCVTTGAIVAQEWAVAGIFALVITLLQFFVAGCFLCTRLPSRCPSTLMYLCTIVGAAVAAAFNDEPFISNTKYNSDALFRSTCMVSVAALFQVARDVQSALQYDDTQLASLQDMEAQQLPTAMRTAEVKGDLAPEEEPDHAGVFACCGRKIMLPPSNMTKYQK